MESQPLAQLHPGAIEKHAVDHQLTLQGIQVAELPTTGVQPETNEVGMTVEALIFTVLTF